MSPWHFVLSAFRAIGFGAVGGAVGRSVRRRYFGWKYESTDQIKCYLRRDQPDEVITGRWRHGLATLSSGRIDFQPRSALGLGLNLGAPFVISVLSASDTGRHPSWRQAWHLTPGLKIVMLETANGPNELAVQPELASKVDQPVQ